jgi:hypothetical protein
VPPDRAELSPRLPWRPSWHWSFRRAPQTRRDINVNSGGHGHHGGVDIFTTTQNYVQTFYPLWFTYRQFQVVPHNQFIGPDEILPLYQGVVAINDDTLYASSPIDVTTAPVTLTVPETAAGYSVLLLDPYGNVYESGVPSKPAGVFTPTTVYSLVAPGYSELVPAETTLVRLPLDFKVLIFSDGVDETAEADAFRAAFELNGIQTSIRPVAEFTFPFKTIADTLIRREPIRFLSQTQEAIASASTPPLTPQEQKLSDDLDTLYGDGSGLGPEEEEALLAEGARAAHDALLRNYFGNRDANNWIHFTNIGDSGKNVLDRASNTEFIQFGNGIDTAVYYHTFLDGNGAPLEGGDSDGVCVLTFPPGGYPRGVPLLVAHRLYAKCHRADPERDRPVRRGQLYAGTGDESRRVDPDLHLGDAARRRAGGELASVVRPGFQPDAPCVWRSAQERCSQKQVRAAAGPAMVKATSLLDVGWITS